MTLDSRPMWIAIIKDDNGTIKMLKDREPSSVLKGMANYFDSKEHSLVSRFQKFRSCAKVGDVSTSKRGIFIYGYMI